jgi:cytochrome P450
MRRCRIGDLFVVGGVSLEQGSTARPPMIIMMDPAAPAEAPEARVEGLHAAADRDARDADSCADAEVLGSDRPPRRFDFIADFLAKLPMDVISTMMGVAEEDQDMLREWADLLLHREEGKSEIPKAGLEASAKLVR